MVTATLRLLDKEVMAQKAPISKCLMCTNGFLTKPIDPPDGWRTRHSTSIVGDHRPRCITSRATPESFKAHFGDSVRTLRESFRIYEISFSIYIFSPGVEKGLEGSFFGMNFRDYG